MDDVVLHNETVIKKLLQCTSFLLAALDSALNHIIILLHRNSFL